MFSAEALSTLESQAIELPSWAFGNSGTRFRVFTTPGTPRTVFEKIDDAAKVHEFTKLAPAVALHTSLGPLPTWILRFARGQLTIIYRASTSCTRRVLGT